MSVCTHAHHAGVCMCGVRWALHEGFLNLGVGHSALQPLLIGLAIAVRVVDLGNHSADRITNVPVVSIALRGRTLQCTQQWCALCRQAGRKARPGFLVIAAQVHERCMLYARKPVLKLLVVRLQRKACLVCLHRLHGRCMLRAECQLHGVHW